MGGFVTKGISLEPMAGHAAPRIVQTAAGMLNAIGLQNVGVEEFVAAEAAADEAVSALQGDRQRLRLHGGRIHRGDRAAQRGGGDRGLRVECSCPNVHAGGMAFGADSGSLEYLVSRAKAVSMRPLIVKLSPNVTSIAHMSTDCGRRRSRCAESGEYLSGHVDRRGRKAAAAKQHHRGAFGPAIKPIALRMVYEASGAVSIPIIGMGGIVTAEDAVEFMLAGATAVQVGTASYADPRATERLAKGLESWCKSHDVKQVSSLTGALEVPRA